MKGGKPVLFGWHVIVLCFSLFLINFLKNNLKIFFYYCFITSVLDLLLSTGIGFFEKKKKRFICGKVTFHKQVDSCLWEYLN